MAMSWTGFVQPATAQYAPWTARKIDDAASVQMPNEGSEDSDPAVPSVRHYFMNSSDNSFEIYRVDLSSLSTLVPKPGSTRQRVLDIDKFFTGYFKQPGQRFHRAKLQHAYETKLPTAPGDVGFHRVYYGFDEQTQAAAVLEITWVYREGILYLFNCLNSLPEDPGSSEDKLHFFSTIHFDSP